MTSKTAGSNLGEGTNVISWIRILRIVLAWAILIFVILIRNRGREDGALWIPRWFIDFNT